LRVWPQPLLDSGCCSPAGAERCNGAATPLGHDLLRLLPDVVNDLVRHRLARRFPRGLKLGR
jgi:hypothetical protein